MTATDAHRTIDAVWRIESARLIAGLTRVVRDVGLAEELAQDALVRALEEWPRSGIPDNPGAWLMATAKNRGIDHLRHERMRAAKHEALGHELEMEQHTNGARLEAKADDEIGDDLLRLIFIACHPLLSTEARTALTLRLLAGLTTEEIARAFLVPEPTIAQRIVRAKRTLSDAHVPFEIPRGKELAGRLSSVLEVIYLVFNEGYSATAGEDWMRPALCEEALRIGRILAELAPLEPEVHGLVALMEIQASRIRARTGPNGEPVLLMDQNRANWDRLLIHRGLLALARGAALAETRGPYLLQAAIAACHARAPTPEDTDWVQITALYDELARIAPSPVVELNRAVAVAMAYGPAAGLELANRLQAEGSLRSYHLLPSVRGDLLARLGRSPRRRSWSSTARWPSPWPTGPRRDSSSRTGSRPRARSAPITCCRACAAIFSPGSAATRKRAASLSVRRRSRRMRARAACCSSAPPPASREKRPDAAKRVPPPQRARAGAPSARLPESFMQYMLLIVEPQGQRRTRTPEEGRAVYGQMLAYTESLKARGVLLESNSLREKSARLKVRDGRRSVTDGPFAEAKELVGGFFLLDCPSREQALGYAAECPAAAWAAIEVREVGPCYE